MINATPSRGVPVTMTVVCALRKNASSRVARSRLRNSRRMYDIIITTLLHVRAIDWKESGREKNAKERLKEKKKAHINHTVLS